MWEFTCPYIGSTRLGKETSASRPRKEKTRNMTSKKITGGKKANQEKF